MSMTTSPRPALGTDAAPYLYLNDQRVSLADVDPNTTLLRYLRDLQGLTGTKEGCAEGDCGACTVVVYEPVSPSLDQPTYRALNACLLLAHAMHSRHVYTVEGLVSRRAESVHGHGVGLGREHAHPSHPVQDALVERLGSQCGYCTPGVIMSLVEACYREDLSEPWQIDDQLCGNLCRCTGYRPIQETAEAVAGLRPPGALLDRLTEPEREEDQEARRRSLSFERSGQQIACPRDLDALWDAWSADPSAELVAGGTDLMLRVTKRFEELPALISIDLVRELRELEETPDGAWRIGASVPLSDLERHAASRRPMLERMLRFFGARQIKNRGTLGGNLCTASPIGDLAPTLLALNARLVLASASGERVVSIDEFFTGYRQTCLRPQELLRAVEIPRTRAELSYHERAYKVSKRQELDISSISAAFSIGLSEDEQGETRVEEVRLAYGGMAATPARARHAEDVLRGQAWSLARVEEAAQALAQDFQPISDHRASAWYRAEVAANLLRGFWLELQSATPERLAYRPTATLQLTTAHGDHASTDTSATPRGGEEITL